MPAVEHAEPVGIACLAQFVLQRNQFGVVEIEITHGREDSESRTARRLSARKKAGPVKQDPCRALAAHRQHSRHARAAGKSREVDAPFVDRKSRGHILQHGISGFDLRAAGTVSRIVGCGQDVAELFRRLFLKLHGRFPVRARVEGKNDGPAVIGRIVGGKIECVGLSGMVRSDHLIEDDPRLKRCRREGTSALLPDSSTFVASKARAEQRRVRSPDEYISTGFAQSGAPRPHGIGGKRVTINSLLAPFQAIQGRRMKFL